MKYKVGDRFKGRISKKEYYIMGIFPDEQIYTMSCMETGDTQEILSEYIDTIFNILKSKKPETAAKADDGKVPLQLLCPTALEGTAKVLQFGRDKYTKITGKDASHNWKLGMPWSKVIGSILRHLFAIMRGEDIDSDSGLPHVDHLGCEIMFLQSYMAQGIGEDDRYKYKGDKS